METTRKSSPKTLFLDIISNVNINFSFHCPMLFLSYVYSYSVSHTNVCKYTQKKYINEKLSHHNHILWWKRAQEIEFFWIMRVAFFSLTSSQFSFILNILASFIHSIRLRKCDLSKKKKKKSFHKSLCRKDSLQY